MMVTTAENMEGVVPMSKSYKLLVVEDNPGVRQFYFEILTNAGYSVDLAEDGEAGWDAVHANKYDLIVTDHDMPRLTGIGLIERLCRAERDEPVILVTGTISLDDFYFKRQNLFAQVAKPFSVGVFLAKIEEALQRGKGGNTFRRSINSIMPTIRSGYEQASRLNCCRWWEKDYDPSALPEAL